ncbi:Bug family tripartite tricarboxylate transporter substrate binding protein [Falsiroseomonas sp. HC035]|uniref:Bug family tripartite tricarboxylate transporter substrate binding protein n=1 Tax=Falsiroseomonas sp. HC035 TaxID=3390999 RepID=UPI003D31BC4D
MINRRTLTSGLAALPLLRARGAGAQARYPDRPVRMIVGFPAGGGVDLTARPLAQKLSERFGQQFVVDNRGGAGGNIGMDLVAKAPADGHTLLVGNVGMLAINPALYSSLTFDTVADFAPIAQIVAVPLAVAVPADLPVRNLAEFIAMAKARPGALNMGSGGNGGIPHLAFELLKRRAGIDVVHVPYRGSAPALQDLLGSRLQLMIDGYNLMRAAAESGRIRIIATTGRERLPALPDVPTVQESGVEGFEAVGWQGILAPAATPAPILAQLEEAIGWALRDTDLPRAYLAQGQLPIFQGREAFTQTVRREREQWTRVVREANVSLD